MILWKINPKVLLCIFVSIHAYSQNTLSGTILDNFNQPIPFADILLVDEQGIITSNRSISNETGKFVLSTDLVGLYQVRIISIGFQPYNSQLIKLSQKDEISIGKIVLEEAAYSLNDVDVTAKKIPFKREIDRTVISLEDDASASGSSILDILERTPGILIDRQNESISMLGKEGVNVMINGKMSYMPAAALVQFLNGINAENAKTIELITTPPAKFDAQGNAGYINIELKQQLEKGYNGNMTSSLSIGSQRTNQNIGSNFNVSDQKSTLIFNYSIRKNYIPFVFDLSRSLSTNGQTETSNIKGARDNKREVHNIRFGYDYKINEHLNLGINVTGYANSYSMTEDKTIRRNTQPNNDLYFTSEDNFWKNVQTSFYSDLRLSENSLLKFNFDYLRYANDQPVNYQIDLSASENTSQLTLDTTKNSPFTIYVNALDFETKKENGLQVTGGIKYVQNDFRNTNELQRNQVFDTTFASDSKLEESISAAYSQVHFNLSKNIKIQTGVRYEYTQTKVISLISNQEFINRKYGNFFPSFFMGYKINDFNNLNVSISQRINRPAFTDIAPFVFFVDLDQAFQGNVALRPSYTNNFQLDYRLKSINLSLQYANEKDAINRFQPQVNTETGFITIIPDNIDQQNTLSAIISYSFYPVPKWNIRAFSTLAFTELSNRSNTSLYSVKNTSIRFNLNNTFSLGKGFSFQIWGYYNSRSVSGVNITLPNGSLNFSLQKKQGNLTYTLNANNVLDTQRWRFESINPETNYYQSFDLNFSPPQVKLAIAYNFGNQKIKAKKLRTSEEARRINF